jgi:hypothetical protein
MHTLPTRRDLLAASTCGLGSVALTWLLHQDGLLRAEPQKPELDARKYDLKPKKPHHPPRARAMISLFMQGGPSHVDLLDPKPLLTKLSGTKYQGDLVQDNVAEASKTLLGSPWKFAKQGRCGTEVSDLLPHLAGIIDDVCVIRSMHTSVNNHGQSIYAMTTGRIDAGRPVLGSWLTYGLGSESQDLPAFVVLTDPEGLPVLGVDTWSNGWLPSLFQGTVIRPREPRILNLDPPPLVKGEPQKRYLEYLDRLNREYSAARPGETDLDARIASYELAARMQTAAREALDLAGESEATRKLYGLDDPATQEYGARCLIARRLVERGVRFVQLFTRYQFWDHHGHLKASLAAACKKTDKPAAALVKDLKARGLLDTTLVHWGGEMGRLPVIQNDTGPDRVGRDHNTYGFSMWLAGGGIKGGLVHGATDDFGYKTVKDPVSHSDYHATLLHLFGLDPKRLTWLRNAQERSLLDGQSCRVVKEILRDG